MDCERRGFHRIPALELQCIECGDVLTPEETLENERRKIEKMGFDEEVEA